MNLPNKLTISRIILAPVIITLMFVDFPYHYYIAVFLYLTGCITDLLDGYIARKYNLGSNLGIFLDPMADKIFNLSMMLVLLYLHVFPLWIAVLVFIRDMMVDSFLNYSLSNKIFIKATYPGKYKSLMLNFAIIIGIIAQSVYSGQPFFGLSYGDLYNAAYFILILSFLVGFIGSISLMEEYHKKTEIGLNG